VPGKFEPDVSHGVCCVGSGDGRFAGSKGAADVGRGFV
jgi:hypothetical protein